MSKNEFPKGISIKEPRQGAPDFVKGDVGVNFQQFVEWAKPYVNEKGYINFSLNKSAKGNLYFSFYNKDAQDTNDLNLDEITFDLK